MRVGGGIALWVLVISCLLFTSCQDDAPETKKEVMDYVSRYIY